MFLSICENGLVSLVDLKAVKGPVNRSINPLNADYYIYVFSCELDLNYKSSAEPFINRIDVYPYFIKGYILRL